jgi:tetratricopeptide (TPR) repeat protein
VDISKLSRKKQQNGEFDILEFYRTSGKIYRRKGLYIRAVEEYKKALQVSIMQMGVNHHETAENYSDLGVTYEVAGQYQLALDNLINALEIYEKCYANSNRSLFTLYLIGDTYRQKKEYDLAKDYFQKAAAILGKASPDTYEATFTKSNIFYKLGIILGDVSNVDRGLEFALDALERKKKDHQGVPCDTTDVLQMIGQIETVKGEFEIALGFFENALSQSLHLYGPNHASVARLYFNKSMLLEYLVRNEEALTAFEAALDIRKKLYPEGHRELADTLSRIGNQYRLKKEFAQAKNYCEEALAMQRRMLLPDHVDICTPLYYIGMILYDQQDYKESLSYLWKAQNIGKGHIDTTSHIGQGELLTAIGDNNRQLKNISFARQCFEEAISCYKIFFSHQHRFILESESKIKALEEKAQTS